MPAFLLSLVAFVLAIGPHYFLKLGFLEGAHGAQLTLTCRWTYHPEPYLAFLLVPGILFGLKTRKAFGYTALIGVLVLVQAYRLEPLTGYLGADHAILLLAERSALQAHEGLRPFLGVCGLVIFLVSLLFMWPPRRVSQTHLTLFSLAVRNLRQRRFRTASLVMAVSMAVGAIFAYTLLMRTVENTLEVGAGRLGADLMVVPEGHEQSANAVLLSGEPTLFYMPASHVEEVAGVEGVERVSPQIYIRPLSYTVCCSMEEILVVGYNPETDFTVAPWIEYVLAEKQSRMELVVGKGVKYYPGQEVTMYNRKLQVSGNLEKTGLGYFDNSGFIPIDDIHELIGGIGKIELTITDEDLETLRDESFTHLFHPEDVGGDIRLPHPDEISSIFVKVGEGLAINEVADRIRAALPGVDVVAVKASTRSAKEHIAAILSAFLLPVAVLWFMCAGMIAGVYSMSVNERQREVGLLRAMGARRRQVAVLFLLEVLALSGLGGVLGLELGVAIVLAFIENVFSSLNLIYIWPQAADLGLLLGSALLISIATGFAAALYPALRSSRLEPYATIRGGE